MTEDVNAAAGIFTRHGSTPEPELIDMITNEEKKQLGEFTYMKNRLSGGT